MKNHFYFAIASMIALSSCSDNVIFTGEKTESVKTPITLDVYQQGETRATITTAEVLEESGFSFVAASVDSVLIKSTVTKNDGTWIYGDTVVYWPLDETKTVNFYGLYSPNSEDKINDNGTATININGENDVVASYNSSNLSSTTDGQVSLSFRHILSQVVVSAKGDDPQFSYIVSSITISAPNSIVYTFGNPGNSVAGPNATSSSITYFNYGDNEGVSIDENTSNYIDLSNQNNNLLIIPALESTLTVHYYVSDGTTTKEYTREASITPLAGEKNRVRLTLPSSRTPMSFTVSLDDTGWTTENNIDKTVQ